MHHSEKYGFPTDAYKPDIPVSTNLTLLEKKKDPFLCEHSVCTSGYAWGSMNSGFINVDCTLVIYSFREHGHYRRAGPTLIFSVPLPPFYSPPPQ